MNNELLAEYADLVRQIKLLEEKKDHYAAVILDDLTKENLEKVQSDLGTFSRINTSKWTFTEEVKDAEARVKELKEVEKERGVAVEEKSKSLRFQAAKT